MQKIEIQYRPRNPCLGLVWCFVTKVPSKLRGKLCHAAVLEFHAGLGDCNIFTCNKHYALVGPIAQFICSAHSIKNAVAS